MWTTSSSLADRRAPVALLLAAALWVPLAGCRAADHPAPDAPRAAASAGAEGQASRARPQEAQELELLRVTFRRLDRADDPLARLAGSTFWQRATEPLVLEAQLAPFPLPVGDSFPVLVLNGEILQDTVIDPGAEHTLVAFLPDKSRLEAENRVGVRWIGREGGQPPAALVLPRAEIEAQLEEGN